MDISEYMTLEDAMKIKAKPTRAESEAFMRYINADTDEVIEVQEKTITYSKEK